MNSTIEVTCNDLDDQGRGICKTAGQLFIINGILPGEKGIATINYYKQKIGFGIIEKILIKSKYRVATPTDQNDEEWSLTYLAYPQRLEFKRQVIKRLAKKFGHLDLEVLPTISCPVQTEFRNKVQKPVGYDKKTGKLICGFYRPGTHEIIPSTGLESESLLSIKITKELMRLLNAFGYKAYDEDKQRGQIRHILIRTSYHYSQALVTIVTADRNLKGIKDLARKLCEAIHEVKGVVMNVNKRHTNVILGAEEHQVYGASRIKDQILGLDFSISSKSFYQTNPILLDTLYSKAIEAAHLTGKERVLDAYCGTGTIGICMAKQALNVTGVEIEKSSFEDAKLNAKTNGIKNIFFRNEDATEFIENTKGKFDVVVLDPPRKGTTPQFIKAIERIVPKRVVYISCDPATLGRDLGLFFKDYYVESIRGIDMFPTTHHVETVVLLEPKMSH